LLTHHSWAFLSAATLSWAGHTLHVSLPVLVGSQAGVEPAVLPLPHQYILRHLFVVIFPYAGYGPCIGSGWTSAAVGFWPYLLDPVSSCLAITEVSDHHLALSVFLVGLGLLVRGLLPWRLGQYIGALSNAQLSLCLAGLGSAALGLSHHLYAMPPYPYLAPD
jgi:photosystem I P700 chlorophyll a apoprotein A1